MTSRTTTLLGAFLFAIFVTSAQASGGDRGFTERSLKGTYYIPCACEGNFPLDGGGESIHVGGVGKAEFDGKGEITITQQSVYRETQGVVEHIVVGGLDPSSDNEAKVTGSYTVDSEGFGYIVWEERPKPLPPLKDASFLITEARDRNATAVYMLIPQFFTLTGEETLIHVTAKKRLVFDD